jgi:hypothetical protein
MPDSQTDVQTPNTQISILANTQIFVVPGHQESQKLAISSSNREPHTHEWRSFSKKKKKTPKVIAPEMPIPVQSRLGSPRSTRRFFGTVHEWPNGRGRARPRMPSPTFRELVKKKEKSNPGLKTKSNKKPPFVRRSLPQ